MQLVCNCWCGHTGCLTMKVAQNRGLTSSSSVVRLSLLKHPFPCRSALIPRGPLGAASASSALSQRSPAKRARALQMPTSAPTVTRLQPSANNPRTARSTCCCCLCHHSLGWTERGAPGDLPTSWWLEQVVDGLSGDLPTNPTCMWGRPTRKARGLDLSLLRAAVRAAPGPGRASRAPGGLIVREGPWTRTSATASCGMEGPTLPALRLGDARRPTLSKPGRQP